MAVNFPSNPTNGDIHNEKGRRWIYDSTSGAWKSIVNSTTIDTDTLIEGDNLFYTDARVQTKLGSVSDHILPDTDIAYDLGSATNRFRDLYLSGNSIELGNKTITEDNIPEVNLAIAPEVLEIQVSAPQAGQDTQWLWTWLTSSLPYARREITNSPEIQVPLYKQGTYTVNNYAAYDIFDQMTQTHSLYLKWIDGAGTDNLISWATSTGPVSDSHPDINSGNATDVQRINISVPSTITPPTLTAPNVSYTVVNNGAGAYTFSGAAKGDNPNLGPFYRGGTYTIDITATGHPLYFTTDNGTNFTSGGYFGEYTTGVTGSRTDSGTITFTVPQDAPDTLYYQCGNHGVMRGAITIRDLAVEVNNNGNYIVYFQHTQEGHKTPVELRPIPSLVNQMCLVYDAGSGKFVPQDLATYVENTPSFENKIREVAGTAELVVEDGSAVIAKVNVYDDSTYLPLVGNNPGDQAFATDTDILYIWDGSAWQQAGAANTDDLAEGTTNLFYTDTRVANYLSANDFDTATNIIASITDSAPATLDTLNELAAALGDDPNFATTTANNIALKAPIDNPTFTGTITTPAIIVDTTNPQIQFHPGAQDDWRMQMDDSSKWINFIYNGGTKASIKNNGQISATSFSGDGSSISNVNAVTIDGLDSTQFLRSDADDTISGSVTFTKQGAAGYGTINLQSADPFIRFYDSDGPVDKKKWDLRAIGSTANQGFEIRTVNDANDTFNTKLYITHDGDVGIGTFEPDSKFHVYKNTSGANESFAKFSYRSHDANAVEFKTEADYTVTGVAGFSMKGPWFHGSGVSYGYQTDIIRWKDRWLKIGIDRDDDATKTPSVSLANDQFVVLSDGNVGIGTDTPIGKLSIVDPTTGNGIEIEPEIVTDTNRITNFDRGASAYKKFRLDASEQQFYISGTEIMCITSNGQLVIGDSNPYSSRKVTSVGTSAIPDPSIALVPYGNSDARIDFLTSSRATNFYVGMDSSSDELKITGNQGFSVPALTINQSEHVKLWNYLVLSQSGLTTSSLDANAPAGSLAYTTDDSGDLYYKNSTGWKSVTAKLGTQANPAQSAQQILDAGDSVGDGIYWLQPGGYIGSAFQVYCDMTSYGGGWMIVSKWYQDAPYSVDELFNANARNADTTYLLNANQLTAKSTHARLSRDQMNALWNQSSHIARIWTTESSNSTGSPYGTYFQKKITNTNGFDFWNAHYSALLWSDQITNGVSYIQNPGSTYKVMRYETSGNIFTDSSFTDFSQQSVSNGPGYWDNVTVNAPNYGNIQVTRHMGFYGDIYAGNQWILTSNPTDSRFTGADSSEGKRTIVYLK